jgi:hypothetical protein
MTTTFRTATLLGKKISARQIPEPLFPRLHGYFYRVIRDMSGPASQNIVGPAAQRLFRASKVVNRALSFMRGSEAPILNHEILKS